LPGPRVPHFPGGVPFTGVFDGNNNSIYGFTYSSTEEDGVGLFGLVNDANAEIRNLTLIAPDVNAATKSSVGSLVGVLHAGHILDCKVEGGSICGRNSIGGLAGRVTSTSGRITDCYSNSIVSGADNIGGLVGYNAQMLLPSLGGTITKCFASGTVNGDDNIGGLVGFNSGPISDCYSTTEVSGSRTTGGLVGSNGSYGTITNCYATGNVEGHENTGGMVGRASGGTITNCYAVGDVDGITDTGGLIGSNNAGLFPSITVSNCYAAGDVNGISNTGGLVGSDPSNSWGWVFVSYTSCFWDSDVNPDVNGIGNSTDPNVIGKTTTEMQTESTFTAAGWDFTTPVWKMCYEPNYPRLWWEECPEPVEVRLWIFPQVINRHSRLKRIMAWLHLPEGITKDQISDEPLVLYPQGDPNGIKAIRQFVFEHGRLSRRRASIFAFFDKAQLMEVVPDNGRVQLDVVGRLTTSQYIYGSDTVWIKGWPWRWRRWLRR